MASGLSARQTMPGPNAATARSSEPIVTPWSAASFTDRGLPATAVTNMEAEVMLAWKAHRMR